MSLAEPAEANVFGVTRLALVPRKTGHLISKEIHPFSCSNVQKDCRTPSMFPESEALSQTRASSENSFLPFARACRVAGVQAGFWSMPHVLPVPYFGTFQLSDRLKSHDTESFEAPG
jgi:hypothetical protein